MNPLQTLFNTIQEIDAAGKVKLSSDERSIIERETRDLLRKSQMKNYKFAASMPQGFQGLLNELKSADAEEAYKLIKDFMDSEEDSEESEESEEMGGFDIGEGKKEEKDDDNEDDVEEIKEEVEEKKEKKDKGKKEEKEDDEDEDEDEDEDGEKPDFLKDKKEVMARLRNRKSQMGPGAKTPERGKGPVDMDPDMDGDKDDKPLRNKDDKRGPGKSRMKDLKDCKDKDEKKPSMSEMGIEDVDTDPTITARSKKVKVRVTPERNIIAYYDESGPVFMLKPNAKTKASKQAMIRLANRAYGLAVYEGFKSAATKLGAKMFRSAGVDDDITVVTQEKPESPVDKSITDEAETVADDSPVGEYTSDNTQEDAEDVIEQERPKLARYQVITKGAAEGDLTKHVDTVTQVKPEPKKDKLTEDAEDVAEEAKPSIKSDMLEDAEVDYKTAKRIEAEYKRLYAARLKKAEENFVRKFAQCMRIASKRMLLNHDENPFKIALADVLTSDNVELDGGDLFKPMNQHVAIQLTELISTEGHDDFVDHLVDRTADLMEKSSEYLNDVESDLANLRPVAVEVSEEHIEQPRRANRASEMRRAASKGNFGLTNRVATARPSTKQGSLREAISGSDLKVNRLLGKVNG